MRQALGNTAHARKLTPGEVIVRSFRFLGHVTEYCKELGLNAGFRWYCARILGHFPVPSPWQVVIKPADVLHPLLVRLKPSSDEYVFDLLFVRHEYAPVCDRLKDPKVILDLGANVGYASAFFASRYPAARIIAVEPDPRTYEICRQNLEPYGDRIRVLNGAVWSRCSRLALSHELGEGVATQVMVADHESNAEVDAWDIPKLLDIAGAETADLLKIDIEGSEAELFGVDAVRWLPRARNICIELHGQRCRDIFFTTLSSFDCDLIETGESTLCMNLRAGAQATNLPRDASARSRA